MKVYYVVVGFHPREAAASVYDTSISILSGGDKWVNMSEIGNLMICGVAQDISEAQTIAAREEATYGKNICIFNALSK